MPRPIGSKNNQKSTRKQSDREKQLQNERAQSTKRLNKKIKEDKKAREEAEKVQRNAEELKKKRANFFAARSSTSAKVSVVSETVEEVAGIVTNINTESDFLNFGAIEEGGADVAATVHNPAITDIYAPVEPIAELVYNEEDAAGNNFDDDVDWELQGIQQMYVKAIQDRLQKEVSSKSDSANSWLIKRLKENSWWLPKSHHNWFISQYNKAREPGVDELKRGLSAYYRDVYVWLPDVMWPSPDSRYMPPCPQCASNKRVGPHCFRSNHAGRVIIDLSETYYVLSRRYICHACEDLTKQSKKRLEEAAAESSLSVEVAVDERQYTFMGWNQSSLPLLPYNKGNVFPAILTWRAGVDKKLTIKLRQDVDQGKGFDRISKDLLEMHTERYTDSHLEYENSIKERIDGNFDNGKHYQRFSAFGDKKLYRGLVPDGHYLQHVFELDHESIRSHLTKEVKKRGASTLHWDVSYKEAKHICRVRGKAVFKGLVTATNEIGEVRIQFHVFTDSHEQMKAALEAFHHTTQSLGQPPVKYFWTDNPTGDKGYFLEQIPSVRTRQDQLDELCNKDNAKSATTTSSRLPSYDYDSIDVNLISSKTECNQKLNAMKILMRDDTIGLDVEWNVNRDRYGNQTSSSKIMTIQISYRGDDDKLHVFIFTTAKWDALPSSMISLLCEENTTIVGVKVSSDLKKIAEDFDVGEMKKVNQLKRSNVCNLGPYARDRDVVQNANHASMVLLSERVLGIAINKSEQVSDWSRELSSAQIKYAAIDAAVSLELYEKMKAMPNLASRLNKDEVKRAIGKQVDLVPIHGRSVPIASLNTRAAIVTVTDMASCPCPVGITVQRGRRRDRIAPDANSCIVKLDTICAPSFVIPGFKMQGTQDNVSLRDIGNQHIVVPIAMLREHHSSVDVRPTPAIDQTEEIGPSPPSTRDAPKRMPSKQFKQPMHDDFDYNSSNKRVPKGVGDPDEDEEPADAVDEDEHDVGEYVDGVVDYEEFIADEYDAHVNGLTTREINWLEGAIFQAHEAECGNIDAIEALRCQKLDDTKMPQHIQNKHSAVLGDIFHAMNRCRVAVKHEAKKAYFNALRNAFLIHHPGKLQAFIAKLKEEEGMSDKEIDAMKYFRPHVFDECIERIAPAPKIMYYRVRAVFVLFGNMRDSKTKKPLFNDSAWTKANQVLKEILQGYYSDPPDANLYCKKMSSDGQYVLKNKYGMDLIECHRGTNRVEAYHKHLVPAVRSRNFGVKMADYLLASRRHRHNHNISVARRRHYPNLGHYSTWKIDQLQDLHLHNHGVVLYPGWINASAFKSTDETFDTIALHDMGLDDALRDRAKELGKVNLSNDLQYMCDAMGVPLPLLPFSGKEEYKLFARLLLEEEGPLDEKRFALKWCKYVDPSNNIHAKLPSHIRVHATNFDRNQRIKETMQKAKSGRAALDELNEKISPEIIDEEDKLDSTLTTHKAGDVSSPTRKRKSTDLGLSHVLQEPALPCPMPPPPPQAIHNKPYVSVGGVLIGNLPSVSKPIGRKRKAICTLCCISGCPGRSRHSLCRNKNKDGTSKPPAPVKRKNLCHKCFEYGCKGIGGHKYCDKK